MLSYISLRVKSSWKIIRSKIFQNWTLRFLIPSGSFGAVYFLFFLEQTRLAFNGFSSQSEIILKNFWWKIDAKNFLSLAIFPRCSHLLFISDYKGVVFHRGGSSWPSSQKYGKMGQGDDVLATWSEKKFRGDTFQSDIVCEVVCLQMDFRMTSVDFVFASN